MATKRKGRREGVSESSSIFSMNTFRYFFSRQHKNSKLRYYSTNAIRQIIPRLFYRIRLNSKKKEITQHDADYIFSRVNFYNKLTRCEKYASKLPSLKEFKRPKRAKVYYFDSYEYLRYFRTDLRVALLPGDIIYTPDVPSLVKSRPINDKNANSVILNLDKVRHFTFVKDGKPFASKKDMLVSRNYVSQPHRKRFLEMYFTHPLCNVGQINENENSHKWLVDKLSIDQHLDYKFILCLEGNDVATNLKWVMSSNSLAVMPKPKFETWFMESTLIPNVHYVQINDDFTNLEEQLNHYITHPKEALQIIANAHKYVNQFQNKQREDLISLLVLDKYFEQTGQN